TNRNLEEMVAAGTFRNDLYYRLNVFPIVLPPLRERPDDIPALVRYFAQKFARRMKKRIETIPADAMAALCRYAWPGNVRELENAIERAVILTSGPALRVPASEFRARAVPSAGGDTLEATEREAILRTLHETNWGIGGPGLAVGRVAGASVGDGTLRRGDGHARGPTRRTLGGRARPMLDERDGRARRPVGQGRARSRHVHRFGGQGFAPHDARAGGRSPCLRLHDARDPRGDRNEIMRAPQPRRREGRR